MSLTSPIVTLCLMINILVADSAAPPGYTMNAKSYIVHEKLTLNGQGSIVFKFKTTLSQGLLMYIDGKKTQKRDGNYLLIQLVQSKLVVKLQIGVRLESGLLDKTPTDLNITLGENLNDRMYHYVEVEISKGKVTVMLDHQSRSYTDQRGKTLTLASPVYVGGVPVKDFEEVVFTRTYLEEKFVGCISSIGYRHGNRTSKQKYLKVVKTQESKKGCHDQCLIQPILQCKNGGKCLNLFSKENTACDCRGTGYAGPTCSTASQPLHFTSNSYLSYTNTKHYYPVSSKVLIRFKPASNSGILIYATGKNKDDESLLVELRKRTLVIVSKLPGLKEEVIKMGEQNITDISWRFVQMIVDSRKTDVRYFDGISERRYFRESRSTSELTPPESSFHFQKIYVGGIPPNLAAKSESQFAGCLEDVVINNLDFMKLHRSRSVKSSLYSNGNIDEQCTNEIFDEIKEWSKEREGQSVFENSNHVESGSSNLKSMSGKTKYEDSANSSMWIIIGACVGIVVTTAVVIIVIRVRKNRRRNARRIDEHTANRQYNTKQ
ncbi:neurexin-3-like isoform X2 [Clytia hemisphaerica]|uniref:neurexin-3-like isoform X2 n=1 Tax=Clytia hemisphaerica TaxID=252671 RepID=UPI0034D4F5F0